MGDKPQHASDPCYLCRAPAPPEGWQAACLTGVGLTRPPAVCSCCSERVRQNVGKIPRADRKELEDRMRARGVPPDLQVRAVLVACWHGAVGV